jgi:hypothetical protein
VGPLLRGFGAAPGIEGIEMEPKRAQRLVNSGGRQQMRQVKALVLFAVIASASALAFGSARAQIKTD